MKPVDQGDSDSLDETPLALIGQHVARRNSEPPPPEAPASAPASLSAIRSGQSLAVAIKHHQSAESWTCAMHQATLQPPEPHMGRRLTHRASVCKVSSSLSPSPPPSGLVNVNADSKGSIPVVSTSSEGSDLRLSTRSSGRLARKRTQADTDVMVHQSSKHASGVNKGAVKVMRTQENFSSNASTSLSASINVNPQAILGKNDTNPFLQEISKDGAIGGLEAIKLIESLGPSSSIKGLLLAGSSPGYRGSIADTTSQDKDKDANLGGEISPYGALPQVSVTTFGGHKVTRLAQAPSSQLPPRPSFVQGAHSSESNPVFLPRRSHSSRQLNEDGGADEEAQIEPQAERQFDVDLTADSAREVTDIAFRMGSDRSLGASISENVSSRAGLMPAPYQHLQDSSSARCPPPVDTWSGLIEAGIRRARGSSWQQIREALPPTILAVSSFSEVNQQYLRSSMASSVGSCDAASAVARLHKLFSGWPYRALCSQMDSRPPAAASSRPQSLAQSQKERFPPVGHSIPPEFIDPLLSSSLAGEALLTAAVTDHTSVYKQKQTTRQFARGRAPPPRAPSPDKREHLPDTSAAAMPPSSVEIPPVFDPSVLGQKRETVLPPGFTRGLGQKRETVLPPGFTRGFIFNYSQATMMQVRLYLILRMSQLV